MSGSLLLPLGMMLLLWLLLGLLVSLFTYLLQCTVQVDLFLIDTHVYGMQDPIISSPLIKVLELLEAQGAEARSA